MVLGILSAIAAVPAVIGTTEAVRYGQAQNSKEEHRGRKSNMIVTLPARNKFSQKFDNALIVLKDGKLWIDTEGSHLGALYGHPFAGYYLPYPANQNRWKAAGFKGEGMVSTISDDPPMLNWIFVDKDTHEVKYGVKSAAEQHLTGPWDCTKIDKRVTFEGWEGFCAVEEDAEKDLWALYFDRKDDGFKSCGGHAKSKRSLEVNLWRQEKKRTKKDEMAERAETLSKTAEKEKQRVKEMEQMQKERQSMWPGNQKAPSRPSSAAENPNSRSTSQHRQSPKPHQDPQRTSYEEEVDD